MIGEINIDSYSLLGGWLIFAFVKLHLVRIHLFKPFQLLVKAHHAIEL